MPRKEGVPENMVSSKPKKSREAISFVMELYEWPMIDLSDAEAVRQRIHDYYELCEKWDSKLLVSGLCIALGTDRHELQKWSKGKETVLGKRLSYESAQELQKAVKLLETNWEFAFQNGGFTQPVTGIFIAKNNFGYKDESSTVIHHESSKKGLSKKELAEKYSKALPVDAECEDVGELPEA